MELPNGCLENTDLENTDHRPQTSKTQTSKTDVENSDLEKSFVDFSKRTVVLKQFVCLFFFFDERDSFKTSIACDRKSTKIKIFASC